MAATGFTPIQLYRTSTASATPSAANLADGELAINLTDERLYFKNAAGTVKLLASNASSTGTVSSVAVTVPSFLSVSGSPITTSGTIALSYSGTALPVANGGTGSTTLAANNVLLGNGTGALQVVAPGTTGNVLTSNGTTWTSSTPTTVSAATPTAVGTVYGLTDPNSGLYRTALGYGAVQNGTGASYSVGIGVLALNAVTTGDFNVGVGWGSFRTITTASNNTGVGHASGTATTSGADNTAVGYIALTNNTTGSENVAIGSNALGSANASGNVGIGFNAMLATTSGAQNTGVGGSALRYNTTGEYNAAFGYVASFNNTTGYNNAALGCFALYAATTAYQNTAVGYQAGDKITTGNNNTVIGMGAASSGTNDLTTGSNNIIIGYNAEASSATVSNEITIGTTNHTKARIFGRVTTVMPYLEGMYIVASAPTASQIITSSYGAVQYFTSNATTNFAFNIYGAPAVNLDAVMDVGQSQTVAVMVTNGATAYYLTGVSSAGSTVTTKWQGGTAPTAGNANSIDIYVITMIKTAAATFTALASQTRFA